MILEPARTEEPAPGFLAELSRLCHAERRAADPRRDDHRLPLAPRGAQDLYGVVPDLSTFGKGMANGFSLSALAGKRELMRLGRPRAGEEDVFLLSTTHGAETPALAAAIATMEVYRTEPVVEHLHRRARGSPRACGRSVRAPRADEHVLPVGRPCNLLFATRDPRRPAVAGVPHAVPAGD